MRIAKRPLKPSDEELDSLQSVAIATIDFAGTLIAANAGFLRLLGQDGRERIGSKVSRYFIQPGFASIVEATPDGNGEIYRGLMTVGDFEHPTRTLRARIRRVSEGIRLLAEYDIEELERIGHSMQELNRDTVLEHRASAAENMGLRRRQAEMIETSLTDALTGVGNRRRLDQALPVEIARARRGGDALSILMADIDHFKRVNDGYGHSAGDQVLAQFGKLLRAQTRPTDVVARFGGEEFIVLMPHTALAQAVEVAERIRRLLESQPIDPLPVPVTSSFGAAEYAPEEDAAAFLHRVDAALYRAKDSGRNRVVAADA